jgi:hypothetical protein
MLTSMKPRRVAALLLAGATTVAFAAACGGGDSNSSSTTGTGGSTANGGGNNAFAAYTQCLQKNGVTITRPSARPQFSGGARPSGIPRPSGSAGARGGGFPGGGGFGKPAGVDDATWQKAQAACASLRPSGGPGGFRGGGDNGANAAYRNCLQNHGVTMGQGGLNTADPATAKAIQTCAVLKPSATPTPAA